MIELLFIYISMFLHIYMKLQPMYGDTPREDSRFQEVRVQSNSELSTWVLPSEQEVLLAVEESFQSLLHGFAKSLASLVASAITIHILTH